MSINLQVETESGTEIGAKVNGQLDLGEQSSFVQENKIVEFLRQGIVEKEGTELDYQKGRHDARNGDISERNKTIQYEIGYNKALQDQARNKSTSDSYTQQQKDREIATYENKINQKRKELIFNKDRVEIYKALLEKIDGTDYLVRMMSADERNTYMHGNSLKTDFNTADLKEAFGQNQKIKPEPHRFFSLDDRYRFSTVDKNSPDNINYAHVVIVKMNDALRKYLKDSLVPSDFPGGIPGAIRNNPRIKLETAQGRVDGQVTVGIPMLSWNEFVNKFKDSSKDESAYWNFVSREEVDDHLTFAKINKKGLESSDFISGWNNPDYEKVPIAGHREDMSVLEMKRLAKNLPENSIELGILAHRIHDKEYGKSKVSKVVQTDPKINKPLKLESLFKKYLQDMAEIYNYNQVELSKRRFSGQDGIVVPDNNLTHITRSSSDSHVKELAANMLKSLKKLHQDHNLTPYFTPDFNSVKRLPEGNFRLKLVDSKSSSSVSVLTRDESFIKIKENLIKNKIITRGGFKAAGKFSIPPGLSFYFLLRALSSTQISSNSDRDQINQLSASLVDTFRLHGYLNMASLGIGVTQDLAVTSKFVYQQVKNYIHSVKGVGSNVKLTEHALFKLAANVVDKIPVSGKAVHLLNKAFKGLFIVDTVLGGVSVGLSVQEFIGVQNDGQRKVYGVQLGFDIAGFALSAGALYTFSVGTFGLAATLGLLGIPLAGIGYGIVEAVKYYTSLEDKVKNDVVAYFNEAKANYKEKHGYEHDAEKGVVRLLPRVVFEEVDLETGKITFGSQHIRGRDNKHKDRVSKDDSNPTNLRNAFGVGMVAYMDDSAKNASIINLPDTPKSDISYTMEKILAFSKYKGQAYGVVEEVENYSGKRFELENINSVNSTVINKLYHIYDPNATFTLKLGTLSRIIVVPKTLPRATSTVTTQKIKVYGDWKFPLNTKVKEVLHHTEQLLSNAISYKLIGKGGTYSIALNKGATIDLFSEGTVPSNWILDSTLFEEHDSEDLLIHANKLVIGNVTINIDSSAKGGRIIISRKDGDVYSIDMSNNNPVLKLNRADAERWNNKGGVSIDSHVRSYVNAGNVDARSTKYIPIANYIHHKKQVGTAFYDVENKRMLFTNITSSNYNRLFDKISALQSSWNSSNYFKLKETASKYYRHGDGRNAGGYRIKREYRIALLDVPQFQELQSEVNLLKGQSAQFTALQKQITALRQQQQSLENNLSYIANNLLKWEGADGIFFKEKIGTKDVDFNALKSYQTDKLRDSEVWNSALIELNEFYGSLKSFSTKLKLGLNPAEESMIGAVVDDLIYYYNAKHKLLWTADILTGEVKTQYLPDTLSGVLEGMCVYQAEGEIHVKLNTIFDDKSKGEWIYLIKQDKMELISASSNVYTILKKQTKREETTSLAIWNSPIPTIYTVPTLKSPLVAVYDIDSSDYISNRRWLRNVGNKLETIFAHLPADKKNRNTHLALVGSMSQLNTEVFYFFDSAENTLYRQEGGAILEGQTRHTSTHAERVGASIASIKAINGHLFASLTDGSIYDVAASGKLTFVAVNEGWLKSQGTNWWKNLQILGEDNLVAVYGLGYKNTDRKTAALWAWYSDGKLAISTDPTFGNSLEFLGTNGTADFAYFFDEKKGYLYKQQVYTNPAALFDDHFLLNDPIEVSARLTRILAEETYQVVSKKDDIIELITKEGLILNLDNSEDLYMVGVNHAWMKAHENNLSTSVNILTKKWAKTGFFSWKMGSSMTLTRFDDNELLLLGGSDNDNLVPILLEGSVRTQLSGGLGQDIYNINLLTANNLTGIRIDNYSLDQAIDTLRFTVNNINDLKVIHSLSKDELLFYTNNSATVAVENVSKSHYNHLKIVIDDGKTTATHSVSVLTSLLYGKRGALKYNGGIEVWGHDWSDTYEVNLAKEKLKVFIDNLANRGTLMDTLNLKVNDITKVKAKRRGDHLVLDDDQNEATGYVTINNVFGLNKSKYDHMKLIVTANEGIAKLRKEYQVAALVNGIDQLSNYNNASEYYSLVDVFSASKNYCN